MLQITNFMMIWKGSTKIQNYVDAFIIQISQ